MINMMNVIFRDEQKEKFAQNEEPVWYNIKRALC